VAHAAIDAGADLIIGRHPHILQGIEVYKGKAIFYALGNSCSTTAIDVFTDGKRIHPGQMPHSKKGDPAIIFPRFFWARMEDLKFRGKETRGSKRSSTPCRGYRRN